MARILKVDVLYSWYELGELAGLLVLFGSRISNICHFTGLYFVWSTKAKDSDKDNWLI